MAGVKLLTVSDADGEQRLDRWFKRHFPGLAHGRLEKLLRTGQVRVDGARAKAATHVAPGMVVRIPPLDDTIAAGQIVPRTERYPVREEDAKELRAAILYIDKEVIAIDKPPGLAVQGGTGTGKHLDGMLEALMFEAPERPRLVHRLDRETSGVLLLARSVTAARWLTAAFREKSAEKTYWAAVAGLPKLRRGKIDSPAGADAAAGTEGRTAITYYTVVDHAGQKAAWLALRPLTGRTHQLRLHAVLLGTPILGDQKYDRGEAAATGLQHQDLPQIGRLHLHARALRLRRPDGSWLAVTAPLPAHMRATWEFLGWSDTDDTDLFVDLDGESAQR